MSRELLGQVVVVTGGGRGFGRHISLAIAEAGAKVALVGRTPENLEATAAEIRAAGGTAEYWVADVGDPDLETPTRIVREIEATLGPIDALVNNAGILSLGSVVTIDPDSFWRAFEINVRGPFLWSKAIAPLMVKRGKGRIINITSGAAYMSEANGGAYQATKAALSRLTAVFDAELRGTGVAAFALAPIAQTDMLRELTVSPTMEDRQHDLFKSLEQVAPQLMDASLGLLLAILVGTLDPARGRHLSCRSTISEILEDAKAT